jgi:Flp pilus assembly protein TadD
MRCGAERARATARSLAPSLPRGVSRPGAALAGVLAGVAMAVATATRVAPRPDASPPAPTTGAALPTDVARTVQPLAAPRAEPPATPRAPAVAPPPPASGGAGALLDDAADARTRGDLRTALALLRDAVDRDPGARTHAALGRLYLELGAAGPAADHLRSAVEGDPVDADAWIALADALALKPDPMAAAAALDEARSAEPGIRITRDRNGRLARQPASRTEPPQ